jgi:hypothetical protein
VQQLIGLKSKKDLCLGGVTTDFLDFDPKLPKGIKRFEAILFFDSSDAARFNSFMEPMRETLTALKLSVFTIFPSNVEMILNKLPKLKTLDFSKFSMKDLNKAKLKSNLNINELKIEQFKPDHQYLLLSLVNLEHFTVRACTASKSPTSNGSQEI